MGTLIIKRIPDNVHHDFKVACTVEGTTMREKVIELMRKYVERQEKKKAKK